MQTSKQTCGTTKGDGAWDTWTANKVVLEQHAAEVEAYYSRKSMLEARSRAMHQEPGAGTGFSSASTRPDQEWQARTPIVSDHATHLDPTGPI
eukprot:4219995-Prorocentrum_lima.AAC.1